MASSHSYLQGLWTSGNHELFAMRILTIVLLAAAACVPVETRPTLHPDAAPINMASWQSLLPDNTSLSALSIPGTHDTMSYPRKRRRLPLFTQTQRNDLLTQLRMGVRYLDLRLQHHKNVFTIHHGPTYLHFDLPEVLSIIETFLSTPDATREILLVRLKCNNCHLASKDGAAKGCNGNTREFEDTMEWYVFENPATARWFERWKLWAPPGSGVPTLGEARGKVVFIQNFPGDILFFPIEWGDEEHVLLQDEWTVHRGKQLVSKLKAIRRLWESSSGWDYSSATAKYPLVINHLSASSWAWWPVDVAREVYKALYEWMRTGWDGGGGRPMGVVVGDYVSAAVCRVVVEKNFLEGGAGEAVGEGKREMGMGMDIRRKRGKQE
ncbi:PLC-like phosphodiesterase [Sphaerosporella brunnea]|uniref:PLC-like phosphodiesterase n=1 Tax=Sphaerosporella brunnea TaxID=1250544 RepID=A0A5J5FB93_9PEZI|nr:PLC-like phosphodiesterase [Sphaerosporella brunnea]